MFSVIMPVWNRAAIVGDAIRSVLAQTFRDWELIVVDDGSGDDLSAAVAPFLPDGRVRLLTRPHLGAAAARNHGLAASSRPFVAYLDSDNRWRPGFLAAMAAALRDGDPAPEAAHCLARRLRPGPRPGRLCQDGLVGGPHDVADLLEYPRIDINTFVHSRRCLELAGGFDEGLRRMTDWDFTLRVLSRFEPRFVPLVLVDYFAGVHRPTISDTEDADTAYAQIRAKHEVLRRPVRLVHDTIAYTWDALPPRKHANWIRSRQPAPLGEGGESRVRPYVLQVEPTNRCNLACANCPRAERELRRPPRDLRLGEFRAVVDDLEESLMLLILWDWGEPLLNPDLPRMVRYATDRDIRTVTSTNGHLLGDDRRGKALLEAGLSALIVAVDSVEQETYSRFRRGGSLDRTLDGIRRVVAWKRQLGAPTLITMRTVVTRHNEDRLGDLRALAADLGVDHFSVKTLNPTVDTAFNDATLAPLNPAYRRYAYADGSWERLRKAGAPCPGLAGTAHVHSNGDLVPCSYDFDGAMRIGNVLEQPAGALWNGPAFRALRRAVDGDRERLPRCRCCGVNFELAPGGWFVAAEQSAPEAEAPRPRRGSAPSPAEPLLASPAAEEARLRRGIADRDETIRVLLGSMSWRLTRPLRAALDAARAFRWRLGGRSGERPAVESPRLFPPPPAGGRDWRALAGEIAASCRAGMSVLERRQQALDDFLAGTGRLVLPAAAAPEVSVLLVLRDGAAAAFACLESVKTWVDAPAEVVIVDDGSTDETAALLARIDGARIPRNPRPAGFARAANRAAAAARGAVLLLLDQEAVLQPGALAAALRALADGPDLGAVGGAWLPPDGAAARWPGRIHDTGRVTAATDRPTRGAERPGAPLAADFAARIFLATPRALWEQAGGLDEAFTDGPHLEADYCLRLRRLGRRTVVLADPAVTVGAVPETRAAEEDEERTLARFQARHLEALAGQPPDPRGDRGYALVESGYSAPGTAPPRPPVQLYWHFNEACNFRCAYCFRTLVDHFRGEEHPAVGRFEPEEIAARFAEAGHAWKVVITGGEPLLAPRFAETCRALARRETIALNTNLSTDAAYAFAEAVPPERVHEIYAAVHPVERERVDGGWAGYAERYRELRRRGFPIRAVYVTHPMHFDRMERDLERLRGDGVDRVSLKVFRGQWQGRTYPDDYTAPQREAMERVGLTPLERYVLRNDFRLRDAVCGAGHRALHMDPLGNLTRCNTVAAGYGNLLIGKWRLDDYPSPCPAASCGCPYQGFKYAGDGAYGDDPAPAAPPGPAAATPENRTP